MVSESRGEGVGEGGLPAASPSRNEAQLVHNKPQVSPT